MTASLALALALAAGAPAARGATPAGLAARLTPAPVALYRVAWRRPFVKRAALETSPSEPGGAAVDPTTGVVVFGTRDGWLHALRPDGRVVWELRVHGGFAAPPLVEGDTVYAGSTDGNLYAVALATGKLRWRYEAKEELGTRPVLADGTLYVASLQDTLFAIDARTGAWKWHHRREPRAGFTIRGAASAAVRAGTVYGAYSDGFGAAGGKGQVRWERQVAPAGDYVDVDALAVEGGRLYAAAYSGSVLALDASTGEVAWAFRAPGASRLAVGGGLVIAVTANTVYGLSMASGTPVWNAPLGGAPSGNPALAGKWVVIPAAQGGLRFLEAATGRTLRVFDPGSGVSAAPGVSGGRVYVVSNGGDLYALDLS
jgi:outer membrane protein assembly factor BamB